MTMYDSWKDYMVDMYIDNAVKVVEQEENHLYYVADDTGLVMLDNVDFETAYVYADKHEGCGAYRKI